MKTILIEKMACGGQILIADMIENFPGFPKGIRGPELAEQMVEQAKHFGLEVKTAETRAIGLKKEGKDEFTVMLGGENIRALAVIIATGARWNALGIPGEEPLVGRGVSYCATCDGPLFRNKDVAVVGGGDTALEDALFLTRFANKVTIIHRRGKLRATKVLQERASANKKVEFVLNSVALEVAGKNRVEGVKVRDVATGAEKTVKVDGVFVLIGVTPNSDVAKGILTLDEKGYIVSDDEMRTSFDGIFTCGDVRKKLLRQVVTATGEGATAALSAQHYVEALKGVEYR
jgi:thioredoxin reductase (NADPH)